MSLLRLHTLRPSVVTAPATEIRLEFGNPGQKHGLRSKPSPCTHTLTHTHWRKERQTERHPGSFFRKKHMFDYKTNFYETICSVRRKHWTTRKQRSGRVGEGEGRGDHPLQAPVVAVPKHGSQTSFNFQHCKHQFLSFIPLRASFQPHTPTLRPHPYFRHVRTFPLPNISVEHYSNPTGR